MEGSVACWCILADQRDACVGVSSQKEAKNISHSCWRKRLISQKKAKNIIFCLLLTKEGNCKKKAKNHIFCLLL